MQKINMLHLCHMKGHEKSITYHQKTWHQACLVFMLSAIKKTTAKNYFLNWNMSKNILHYTCYYSESFPHFCAASFSLEPCFTLKLTVSESTFKIKNATLGTYRNFAYACISYLWTKIFARKRDCAITSNLLGQKILSSFQKALTFYKRHEKRLP